MKVKAGRFLLMHLLFNHHSFLLLIIGLIVDVKTPHHVEASLKKEEIQKSQLPKDIPRIFLLVQILANGFYVPRIKHGDQLPISILSDLFMRVVLAGVVCHLEEL